VELKEQMPLLEAEVLIQALISLLNESQIRTFSAEEQQEDGILWKAI
jgi:hypothetical protein